MKTAWDSYLDQQLADPTLRKALRKRPKSSMAAYRQGRVSRIRDALRRELKISPVRYHWQASLRSGSDRRAQP